MGRRVCESERYYRQLEHDGTLKEVIGAYAIGQRASYILDTLAQARVWSYNFGEWVPCPVGYDRTTWTDILDHLVLGRLGRYRCLDCGAFLSDPECLCGGIVETIGLTEGVAL